MPSSTSIPTPEREAARVQAFQPYDRLKATPDAVFDGIAHLVALLFEVPIVFIALVDAQQLWVKADSGMPSPRRVARQESICAQAILRNETTVYRDLTREAPELTQLPLVKAYQMCFYAAQPLQTSEGYNIGTLCVVDRRARAWSALEQGRLQQLARVVMQLLQLRLLLPDAAGQPAHRWIDVSQQLAEVELQLAPPPWSASLENQPLYLPWEQRTIPPDSDAFVESLSRYVERLVSVPKS